MKLPARYKYLTQNPPRLVQEALAEYGVLEGGGAADNPRIVAWADEVARAGPNAYSNWAADWYNKDSIPWCGLFVKVCEVRAGRDGVKNYLAALSWADYGQPVQFKGREGLRLSEILVGDIAVFVRAGGGHVAIVVGVTSDRKNVIVLGGNQGNRVSIVEIPVERLYAVRRPNYKVRPAGARHITLSSTGVTSSGEA